MGCEHEVEFGKALATLEQRTMSNIRRIEKLELQTDALNKLATSVELLVSEQKHQTEAMLGIKTDIDRLDGKVDALEHKPAKRWEAVVEKAILVIVAAVVGYMLTKLGIG